MTMRTVSLVLMVALALVLTPSAWAQTLSLDLEAGYQWVDVSGNQDMYKTQVNQDDGFVLRDFSLNYIDPTADGFVDRMRINASGFGGEPTGRFSFDAGYGKTYRLHLGYWMANNYSALPGFANPFVDDGVYPGQHVWDRDRKVFNIEVELMPGRNFTPIFGYRRNQIDGPRTTTYHVGEDEFKLESNLRETEEEYYVGATFGFGGLAGSLVQGWRTYEGRDRLTLADGSEYGNNSRPVLGLDVSADDISRATHVSEANSPVTTFHLGGKLTDALSFKASYMRADADSETTESEMVSGSLASFDISRFYGSLTEDVASRTKSPSTRSEVEFGIALSDSLHFDVGFERHNRTMNGWSLISTTYQDTMTFTGFDAEDVEELLTISNSGRRTDQRIDGRLRFDSDTGLSVWAGAAQDKIGFDLSESAAEIVVPGHQSGTFERTIRSVTLGAEVKVGNGRLTVDATSDKADDVIMRTDFTSRTRLRARADIPLGKIVNLGARLEKIQTDNIDSGVGYKADSSHYGFDLSVTPSDVGGIHLIWDRVTSDSKVSIRQPWDFQVVDSIYAEQGTDLEALLDLDFDGYGFNAGYSKYKNEGTFGLHLNRAFGRLWLDITKVTSLALEFESNEYSEHVLQAAKYKSDRVGVFFRVRY